MAQEGAEHKKLGNAACKRGDFAAAHSHYNKAIELNAFDATVHFNKGVAFFEERKYDESFAKLEISAEVARQHGQWDDKFKSNLEGAILCFRRSVSENDYPDLHNKAIALEKNIKEEDLKAYINPELAEQEKQKGMELHKKGDFAGAMLHFNEAMKRGLSALDPNRMLCRKLLDFQRALAKEDFNRLAEQMHFERAIQMIDKMGETDREYALMDDEVRVTVRDPETKIILQEMSQGQIGVKKHLKNPVNGKKVLLLVGAGILPLR